LVHEPEVLARDGIPGIQAQHFLEVVRRLGQSPQAGQQRPALLRAW
jgi:hypothetical protein